MSDKKALNKSNISLHDMMKIKSLQEKGEKLEDHGFGHILGTKDYELISNITLNSFLDVLENEFKNFVMKDISEKISQNKKRSIQYYSDENTGFIFYNSWEKLYDAYKYYGLKGLTPRRASAHLYVKYDEETIMDSSVRLKLHLKKLKIHNSTDEKIRIENNKWISQENYKEVMENKFNYKFFKLWLTEEEALKREYMDEIDKGLIKTLLELRGHRNELNARINDILVKLQKSIDNGNLNVCKDKSSEENHSHGSKNGTLKELCTNKNNNILKNEVAYFAMFMNKIRKSGIPISEEKGSLYRSPNIDIIAQIFDEIVKGIGRGYSWVSDSIKDSYKKAKKIGIDEELWNYTAKHEDTIIKHFLTDSDFKDLVDELNKTKV